MTSPRPHRLDASPIPPQQTAVQPVDLSLLHRQHPEEAFITSLSGTDDRFTATATLPSGHPHYASHTATHLSHDPLLLLECARQAETYAAHVLYGVPRDAHFVLHQWRATFPTPRGADHLTETPLVLHGYTQNAQMLRHRLSRLDYNLSLHTHAGCVGNVEMTVGYLSDAAYTALRTRGTGVGGPSTDRLAPTPGRPVDPALVGRIRPTDVVLVDAATRRERASARLRIPTENTSLLDHALDHVPAMVLMEAGRQLAKLASRAWHGTDPGRTHVHGLTASFAAYVELDRPLEIHATPAGNATIDITFEQSTRTVASASMELRTDVGSTP